MSTETTTITQTLAIDLTRTGSGDWREWEAQAPDFDRTGYGATPEEAVRDLMALLRQLRVEVVRVQRKGTLSDHWAAQCETLTALFGGER